ncbi:MAG: glycosyltransferase family 4 protein, partial [Planctomycetota bacterium]
MRILFLSAGTGSFHCGISYRDNALVSGLRACGHSVGLVPLYLPLCLDETDSSDGPLFLGGINMFLQQHLPLFRATPRWLDAAFDCPALLRQASGLTDMTRARGAGTLSASMLRGRAGNQRKELDRLLRWIEARPRPDVVVLSSILLSGLAPMLARRAGIPVFCLMGGEEGFIEGLGAPHTEACWQLIRANAAAIERFLPMSAYAQDELGRRLHLAPHRMRLLYPGIDLTGYAATPVAECHTGPPVIAFLAHMVPIKGLHVLVEAFIRLRRERGDDCRLAVAGSRNLADRAYVAAQCRRLRRAGLADAASFACNIDHRAKQEFLAGASVLAVPALYPEAFGLYCVEAMAAGVPVVAPRRGALGELMAATG